MRVRAIALFLACSAIACGSKPKPKEPEPPKEEPAHEAAAPVVQQELGSIDENETEQTFRKEQANLERCHTEGRERVEYLAGDVKVFLRIDKDGKVRYAYFEESALGDRDTEKCVLDVLGRATWPQPIGGEAEVRHGFGWEAGQERAPVVWDPDKVAQALDAQPTVKKTINECRHGVSGTFRMTAYVEADGAKPKKGKGPKVPPAPRGNGKKGKAHFRAIGVAAPNHDGADKVDCIVSALKDLTLPSPGSYAAKVSFTL